MSRRMLCCLRQSAVKQRSCRAGCVLLSTVCSHTASLSRPPQTARGQQRKGFFWQPYLVPLRPRTDRGAAAALPTPWRPSGGEPGKQQTPPWQQQQQSQANRQSRRPLCGISVAAVTSEPAKQQTSTSRHPPESAKQKTPPARSSQKADQQSSRPLRCAGRKRASEAHPYVARRAMTDCAACTSVWNVETSSSAATLRTP
mmetsp:Transcript_9558/g.28979  ORF Transcript_9558/g.28979 Transcript_9558/m.28979 type:complete len:200 (-) Transcript_9558:318-917(-)